jgi:hypothetical protein
MPPTLTVIWWRDIPAQVVAKDGRRAAKVVLHRRFQVAIDRAAARSGRKEMNAYIAEWRREARRCGEDLEMEATAEAARIEAAYPNDVLKRLYSNGGLADGDGLAPPAAEPTSFWPVPGSAVPGSAVPEPSDPEPGASRADAAADRPVEPSTADQETS